MKVQFATFAVTSVLFLCPALARADLVPLGGEGVQSCQNKKAGDACQNFVIEGMEQKIEDGKCVEEKLDHLHFKFKAHLRCVSASVPRPSASATPSASVVPAPAPTPSSVPEAPSAAPLAPAPTPSAAAEPAKSGSCAWAMEPSHGAGLGAVLFGLLVLFGTRRHKRSN